MAKKAKYRKIIKQLEKKLHSCKRKLNIRDRSIFPAGDLTLFDSIEKMAREGRINTNQNTREQESPDFGTEDDSKSGVRPGYSDMNLKPCQISGMKSYAPEEFGYDRCKLCLLDDNPILCMRHSEETRRKLEEEIKEERLWSGGVAVRGKRKKTKKKRRKRSRKTKRRRRKYR